MDLNTDQPIDPQVEPEESGSDSEPAEQGDKLGPAEGSQDTGKHAKKRRKTRKQRHKAQVARDRPTYDREIVRDNASLVSYYKLQPFLTGESDFNEFMLGLRTPLPASFRVNAFDYDQAKILRYLIKKQFDEYHEVSKNQIGEETTNNGTEQEMAAPTVVPTIEQLEWYPRCLAWQMSISRLDLKKSATLQNLHKFIMAETDNGFISRQESVSMIPPLVLDVQRGQTILDMCAAPGSKTAQLLEYLNIAIHGNDPNPTTRSVGGDDLFDDGLVVANDVDNKRCYMLVHQSNRLNSPNCAIINEDASKLPDMKTFDKEGNEINLKFDRILCDAPCSGDGTVRKNPDVWRKWTVANANNFHGLQSKILRRGIEMLKKNGLLVYSTCSMNPIEDEAVVANILRLGQGNLVLEDCSQKVLGLKYRQGVSKWVVMNRDMEVIDGPDQVKPEQQTQVYRSLFPPTDEEAKSFNLHRCIRMLPHIQNTGAFFIAVIRKLSATLPHEDKSQNDNGSQKTETPVDNSQQQRQQRPDNKKRRNYHGFKEEPFIFVDPTDPDWLSIKEFYGIVDNFPVSQLTHRCSTGKKRSMHLVSKQTGSFIKANQELPERVSFVKVVNAGMRLFSRAESDAGFRICQDGVHEILPYVKRDLMVPINRDDFLLLLNRKTIPFEQLSSESHLKEKLKVGSCILMYTYQNDDVQAEPITIPLVAWRGERTLALYVSNTYRVHLEALVHDKLPEAESVKPPT